MDGESESATEKETGRVLVAYFSWAENAVQNNVDAMTSASVRAPGIIAPAIVATFISTAVEMVYCKGKDRKAESAVVLRLKYL